MIGRAIEPTQDGKERWLHEPCVTLADAERYASESVTAALGLLKEKPPSKWNLVAHFMKTFDDRLSRLEQLSNRVKILEGDLRP
jgi:hypothetical protein